jgi:hypothetical protein
LNKNKHLTLILSKIRVWNYNKSSAEDTLRGCREIRIALGQRLEFKVILRKGPGYPGIKFPQTLLFKEITKQINLIGRTETKLSSSRPGSYITPLVKQDFETQIHPTGLVYKFLTF